MCLVYMVNYLYIHFLVYGFVVFSKIAIVQNYPTPSRITPVQDYPTPPIRVFLLLIFSNRLNMMLKDAPGRVMK